MNKTARLLQSWVFVVCIMVLGAGSAYAAEGKILTEEELKQMLSKKLYIAGWDTRGNRYTDFYSPDGNYRGIEFHSAGERHTTGTWKLEKNQLCRTFQSKDINTDHPLSRPYTFCLQFRQLGEKYEWWETAGGFEGYVYVLGD